VLQDLQFNLVMVVQEVVLLVVQLVKMEQLILVVEVVVNLDNQMVLVVQVLLL
jgi:hypothetical protein